MADKQRHNPEQYQQPATLATQINNQDDVLITIEPNTKGNPAATSATPSTQNGSKSPFSLASHSYFMGFSWVPRQFYLNYLKILALLRTNVISRNEILEFHHLPQLEPEQRVDGTLRLYEVFLDALSRNTSNADKKNSTDDNDESHKLRGEDVYNMIRTTFNSEFIAVHLFIILEIACKLTYSIVIQAILSTFEEEFYTNEFTSTILYTLLLFALLFLSVNFRNKYINILETKTAFARQGLMMLLYKKVGCLTSHQVQKANIGKLFGIMSGDLAQIEFLSQYAFTALWTPLLLAGTTVVICVRLGWFGLIGIACVLLIYPIQQLLGKHMHTCFVQKSIASDGKLKIVSEIIEGIRLIKLHSWEQAMASRIDLARSKEQTSIFKVVLNRAVDRTIANVFVLIAAFLPILSIYFAGDPDSLSSAKIFATLEQINGLKFSLILSGVGIGFLYQWKEISKRFASFITVASKTPQQQQQQSSNNNNNNKLIKEAVSLKSPNNAIEILAGFEMSWTETTATATESPQQPTLKFNSAFEIKKGSFTALVGRIGSGKSTFLQYLIGEVPRTTQQSSKCAIYSSKIAYVEQEPFIFSGKVCDNITFGNAMRVDWYNRVLESCCLLDDLAILPAGDQTEIGERGITLSGGQRARIALARAVYADCDIILLDDPLSAVDARVARSLVQNCLLGILKGKTIILATHQIPLIQQCDSIAIFDTGSLLAVGTYSELQAELAIRSDNQNHQENNDNQEDYCAADDVAVGIENKQASKEKDTKKGEVFSSEKDESVSVTFNSVIRYFKQSRYFLVLLLTVLMFAASEVLFSLFYKTFGGYDTSDSRDNLFRDAGIILACYMITTISKYFSMALLTFLSNKHIHEDMTMKLLRAPISFFERNPSGRLVNKFSGDIGTMDFQLFFLFTDCTENPITFINLIVTVTVYNPWFLLLAFGYGCLLMLWLVFAKNLLVQTRSLDSILKAPVISAFSESIAGTVILRVFKQVEFFAKKFERACNNSISASLWLYNAVRVFQYFGQVLSSLVTFFGILICIYSSETMAELGQSVVYLTLIIELNNYLVGQMVQLNSNLNCAERLFKLCDVLAEGPLVLDSDAKYAKNTIQQQSNRKEYLDQSIPAIEFRNVSLRYRADIELTLKNVSFELKQGELVGCIGRTGAGKSSLLQALFRMVPIETKTGMIAVNGVDVNSMGLNTLRSSMSIIPQTSFVFSGTIRKNIDPIGLYSEDAITNALKTTGLLDTILAMEKKLDTVITNASSALSVGQKQLLCLTRALLGNNRILVLDEATANLDMQTDALIQKTIKSEFKDSAIFTVAHRLNTIADYDRVLVMDDGEIAEIDAPYKLLVREIGDSQITSNSQFAQLVKQTGQKNATAIFEIAKSKYFAKKAD